MLDGNKRLSWLATAVFLQINGTSVSSAADDDVYQLVIDVAASDLAIEQIASSLEEFSHGAQQ